jgi:hypothetical protein
LTVSSTPVPKLLLGTAAACAALLVVLLLAPRAANLNRFGINNPHSGNRGPGKSLLLIAVPI